MPRIRRYFGNFLPMVQHLSLSEPWGSCRQVIYFIGPFQHLEDLRLLGSREGPVDDLTLIPPFAPPLRGSLVMTSFGVVGFLEEMIDLFEGIQFRLMSLSNVGRMRPLLDACAQT